MSLIYRCVVLALTSTEPYFLNMMKWARVAHTTCALISDTICKQNAETCFKSLANYLLSIWMYEKYRKPINVPNSYQFLVLEVTISMMLKTMTTLMTWIRKKKPKLLKLSHQDNKVAACRKINALQPDTWQSKFNACVHKINF